MIIVIVAIDQITKYFAKTYLLGNGAKPFIKGVVEFVYAQNTELHFPFLTADAGFLSHLRLLLRFCVLYICIREKGRAIYGFFGHSE